MSIPKSRPWESALTLLWRVSCSEPGWALRKGERCHISHSGSWATVWKQSACLPLNSFCPVRKNTGWQVTPSKPIKVTWKYKALRLFQNSVYGYMMKTIHLGANPQPQTWPTCPKSIHTPHPPSVMQIRSHNPPSSVIMESTNLPCKNFNCLFSSQPPSR